MTKVAEETRTDWNGARMALSPAEWLAYAEAKPGSYEVRIDGQPLMHYPVSFELALNAFGQFAARGGRVVLVEAGTR